MSILTGVRIKRVEFRENARAFFPGTKQIGHNNEVSIKWGFGV